jgi:GntR family carbon starvation induced transcriptional regulator
MNNKNIDETRNQSTTQRAYIALRDAIITGEIPPGEKLKVETLKASLETGASPVREALSLLTSNQLVERRDQRGFRVALTSRNQFEEILTLRCKLEDIALRASIESGSPEWEEKLVLAHHHMEKSNAEPLVVFEERHKTFHMALLSGCVSPILLRFCEQLYDLNIRYRYLAIKSNGYAKRDVAGEHKAILDAAINGDVGLASSQLISHYRNTGAYLSELIELS